MVETVPAVVRDALARKLDVRRWRREARAAVQSTAAAADGSVSAKPSLASVRSHLAEIDQLRAAARKALALPKAAAVKTEDDESAALADAAAAPTAPAAPTGTADKAVDEAIKKEDVSGDAAVEDDDCGSEEASHALIGALAAAAVASCRAECAQTTDDERELARILQLAEDWALVAKAAKPVAVDDARRLAPTLSTIDDVVRAGEALPLDVSQQLRPLRAAKRLAVAWLESSKRVRHKCGIEDTTEDQGPSEPPPSPASKKANGGASAKKTPGKTSPRGANAGSSRKRKASPPPAAPAPGGRAMTRGAAKRQATPDDAADDATADGDGDAAAPVASSPMVVVVRVKPRDDASTESGTPAQTPAQTPRDSAPPSVAGDASVADDDDDDDDDDENEEDALVTLPELAATLASAKRLSARVDELAQLRMFASRVDAWCHRHREVCPPRRNEPERRSAPKAKADAANSSAPKALADKAAARGEAREAREAQEAVDDAAHKPTPDDLTNLNSAFSAVETQLDVATERAALATRLSDATAARDAVNALVRRVVADAVKALPEHEIRLKALESTARTAEAAETAFTEEAGEGDAGDGAVDSNPGDAKAADAKADPKADPKAVADPKAGADKLAAEKKALKAAAAGDDSDWDSDVDAELEEGDFADARKLLAAELGRFGELSAALRATPRVATRDDARAHDALALQAWCHKARRACSAAAALRGSDSLAERGVDADDVAFLAKQGTDLLMMGMPPMVVPPPPPPGQGRGGYYQQHHQYQVQQQQQYAVQQQALLGHAAGPAASPPPADGEDRLADDLAASRALVSFWRDRLATLQRRFSGVHAWRRAAKAAADRRVVSHRELNELIAAAMDLQRDATLRGSVHEFKHKLDDRLTWLRNVDAALRGPNKRALKDVDALSRDAQKLWLQDSDDARALKMYAKQARAWLARVKKTGIERGEASIAELRALMPEADAIRVDLSADVEVLRQASYATCLCAQPAEGDMLKCISCCELFHRSCVLPRLAEAAVAVAKKKPKRSSSQPAKGNGNNAAAAQKRKRGEANEPSKDTAATDAAAADAASRPGSPDSVAPAVAAVGALALPAVPALPPFFQCPRCILRQLAAADAAAAETLARVAAHTPFCAAAAAALAAPTEADFAARVAGVAAAAANDDERDVSLALRRVAWAYDGLRALERPLQRAAVGVLALRASQLGAPEAASAHFAACCKQADALAARLAAAVAAAPPPPPPAAIDAAALQRTNSASKRGTTARAAAVAAAKPKDAEKKAPSERPIDLAHVRAVAVAARRVPVHLTRLRRRCAAIADDGGARYCACRGPSDGTFMVSCEKCEEWFHGRCVRLTESAADVEFVCYKCGGAATPPNGEADDPLADDADDPPPKNIGEIPWPPSKLLDCMAAHLDATGAAKRAHERAFLDAKKAAADAMQLEDGGAAAAAAVEGLDGTAPAPAAFDAPVPPREEPVVMEVQAPILGVPMDSTEATIVQTLMDIGAPMDIAAPMVTPAATPAAPEPAPPVADAQ